LNALLSSFVLIFLFGLLCVVNSRLSGVRFSLSVVKYCFRYLVASLPMKVGGLDLYFWSSCGKFILQGICVFGSKMFSMCFILSWLTANGVSPDCLIIVKKACSRILQSSVTL